MWTPAVVGFIAGISLSVTLIAVAPRLGWVDHPDQARKTHEKPMALTGGLALWGVLALCQLLGWFPWPLHRMDWIGIHGMALMGALDDRFDLRARYKALFGLIVAILLAGYSSLLLAHTVDHVVFLAFPIPTHPIVTFPLLLFWFWSIPQAYNLIDGVNGLSMGLGLLILTAIGWHLGPQPTILKGALLAILLLNFPRAKHFLGDCGAMLMGTLFAVLTIRLLVPWNANLPLWIFAYPIMDVSLVVATRGWCGLPLGQADRSHLHHWMMDRMNQKVWLATPILLVFAALPMLRVTQLPGVGVFSWVGVCALLALCAKVFRDGIRQNRRTAEKPRAFVPRRPTPFVTEAERRVASGSQHAS